MSLFIANGNGSVGGGRILYTNPTRHQAYTHIPQRCPQLLFPLSSSKRALHAIVSAKKVSTGRFDSKNRRKSTSTTTTDQESVQEVLPGGEVENVSAGSVEGSEVVGDDGFVLPKLPGDEPDFWEGPQWDALGFFVEYLWAFGIFFALVASGIAVVTYNEGATDFKETPAYKESIQSQELLEEPEASNSDLFESNPTEVAPSLE